MQLRNHNRWLADTRAIWHSDDDRREPDERQPPDEERWRRSRPRPAIKPVQNTGPLKYPDLGGGEEEQEEEKKPEVLPQQPTPKQPPQPQAERRAIAGIIRPDQDPEISLGPVHPVVRALVEHEPWDRGGVISRHFHLSPYVAPETHAAAF